jgi:hypothetical protein
VNPGQVGGHILFDWGVTLDIDVVNVWDYNPITGQYTSTDGPAGNPPNPDGITGYGMIDGAFPTFNANFIFQVLPPGTPIAGDFTVFTLPGEVLVNIDMLANADDGGEPGLELELISCEPVVGVTQGAVQTNPDDTCDYTAPDVLGDPPNDQFTYTVFDGLLTSPPGTVTVDLVNEPPACDPPVSLVTTPDTDLPIDEADLLANCTDPDGEEQLSVDAITVPPVNGTLSAALPPFIYTPDAGFTGMDSFEYTVSDTRGGTFTTTANIEISSAPFGNFTMLDASGTTFGGTNDTLAEWDGTFNTAATDTNFNMTLGSASNFPFFGFPWFAHDIRVFGPGEYSFDATCSVAQLQQGLADCGGGPNDFLNLTVGIGQAGAHMLFDWNVTENIDVVLLWDLDDIYINPNPAGALYIGPAGPTPPVDCIYQLVSRDADGDDTPGAKMIDGPFIDFQANFNVNLSRGCAGGGEVDIPKSRIDSPDNGGCTLNNVATEPSRRSDLLLLLAFTAGLGWWRRRRTGARR